MTPFYEFYEIAFACGMLCFLSLIAGGSLCWFLLRRVQLAETSRLLYLAEVGMSYLKAGSATDKAQADSVRKAADLQLKMLEDALAHEQDKKARTQQEMKPTPRFVSGVDSHNNPIEVDLNEGWEIVE